jgi:hypothetical protein
MGGDLWEGTGKTTWKS